MGCARRNFGTAYGAAYITAGTKAVGSVFVRCGLSPSAWRSRSVGSTSVRSASLRMAELRSGGWMRWTSLRSDHRIHPPTLRIRHPPLSFTLSVHPPSLGQKAVSGTAAQSRALFVRCGLSPSAFRPTDHSLLARGYCSVGDACRSLRSLCRFPPPSPLPLPRYARAPPPLGG